MVLAAGSIAEARNVIEKHPVDVIFLDIFLPDGNGMNLLDHWGKDHPCTIIMSAFSDWNNYFSAFSHGSFYFLEKPFKVAKVRSLLGDALKRVTVH